MPLNIVYMEYFDLKDVGTILLKYYNLITSLPLLQLRHATPRHIYILEFQYTIITYKRAVRKLITYKTRLIIISIYIYATRPYIIKNVEN